jgi:ankyrin repeat protein
MSIVDTYLPLFSVIACLFPDVKHSRNDNDNAVETLYHASQTELNDGDDDGRTPLMLACESGNYKSVKTLLSLGADIVIR